MELNFKNGVVTASSATENEDALKEMIAQENADKVGEFSLTDRRHSRITRFMATTLFDENMGGEASAILILWGLEFDTGIKIERKSDDNVRRSRHDDNYGSDDDNNDNNDDCD